MKLINVQFFSPKTYTYEAPDNLPDNASSGDAILVPVGNLHDRNYTNKWKIVRLHSIMEGDAVMAAKSKARKEGFEIKKATMWIDPKLISL